METGRDWHKKIYDALWAYQTTIRTPTNATPSELVYGTKVVLPLHVQKPALKFASLLQLPLDQYQQQRLVQLDLLDERRLKAAEHAQSYRQRIARQYAKSAIERRFKVNDLVFRSIRLISSTILAANGRQIGKVPMSSKRHYPATHIGSSMSMG